VLEMTQITDIISMRSCKPKANTINNKRKKRVNAVAGNFKQQVGYKLCLF